MGKIYKSKDSKQPRRWKKVTNYLRGVRPQHRARTLTALGGALTTPRNGANSVNQNTVAFYKAGPLAGCGVSNDPYSAHRDPLFTNYIESAPQCVEPLSDPSHESTDLSFERASVTIDTSTDLDVSRDSESVVLIDSPALSPIQPEESSSFTPPDFSPLSVPSLDEIWREIEETIYLYEQNDPDNLSVYSSIRDSYATFFNGE